MTNDSEWAIFTMLMWPIHVNLIFFHAYLDNDGEWVVYNVDLTHADDYAMYTSDIITIVNGLYTNVI